MAMPPVRPAAWQQIVGERSREHKLHKEHEQREEDQDEEVVEGVEAVEGVHTTPSQRKCASTCRNCSREEWATCFSSAGCTAPGRRCIQVETGRLAARSRPGLVLQAPRLKTQAGGTKQVLYK